MKLRLGDRAPNFSGDTTEGPINFHQWIGDSWCLLVSHPGDFTPVCTSELACLARMKPEFDRRDVKVISLSVDALGAHKEWADDIKDLEGVRLNFPLIADPNHNIAKLYDMIHPGLEDQSTVRSVFVIGPDKTIRLISTYPQSVGRNFDEMLRAIDALQLCTAHNVVTPANWRSGEDVMISPALSDHQAKETFPNGWRTLRPYIRLVGQPD